MKEECDHLNNVLLLSWTDCQQQCWISKKVPVISMHVWNGYTCRFNDFKTGLLFNFQSQSTSDQQFEREDLPSYPGLFFVTDYYITKKTSTYMFSIQNVSVSLWPSLFSKFLFFWTLTPTPPSTNINAMNILFVDLAMCVKDMISDLHARIRVTLF